MGQPIPDHLIPFENHSALEQVVIEGIRGIYDPELPVNIYDLGLIYSVREDGGGGVNVVMTTTSPACPVAQFLVDEVVRVTEEAINKFSERPVLPTDSPRKTHRMGKSQADVKLTWDPPYTQSMMLEDVRLVLGL